MKSILVVTYRCYFFSRGMTGDRGSWHTMSDVRCLMSEFYFPISPDQGDGSLQAECGVAMTLLFRFAPATFGSLPAVELNLQLTQFHFAIYSLYDSVTDTCQP